MVKPSEFPPAELFAVENLEHLHRLLELGGHGDGGQAGVGERPGALLQHADEVVDADLRVGVVQEPGELAVQILGRQDVCEHSVELGGELVSAGLLQSVDHGLLHVIAEALHVDQPLAQGTGVELLEDILIVQILEYGDTAGKFVINFCFRDSFAGLLEQGVTISDKTVSLEE